MSTYSFRTTWRVPAAPERCWAELEALATGAARSWWPGLRVIAPAPRMEPGAEVVAAVRAPFGYGLRFALRITRAEGCGAVEAVSTGDLDGRGAVELRHRDAGCEIRFTWDVAVRRRWMIASGPVLRPVFSLAHLLVMRAGRRGLRRALVR
jgi:hypothetical protein